LDVFACFPYLILFALAGDLEGIPKITRADEDIGARLLQTRHGMCRCLCYWGGGFTTLVVDASYTVLCAPAFESCLDSLSCDDILHLTHEHAYQVGWLWPVVHFFFGFRVYYF
jgi:hypothetical protein